MRDANTSSSYILLCSQITIKAIRNLYQKKCQEVKGGGGDGRGGKEGVGRKK